MTKTELRKIEVGRAFAKIMLKVYDMADESGLTELELTAGMMDEVSRRVPRVCRLAQDLDNQNQRLQNRLKRTK